MIFVNASDGMFLELNGTRLVISYASNAFLPCLVNLSNFILTDSVSCSGR